MSDSTTNSRYHESLVRLIREMTGVARSLKAFEVASQSDAVTAHPPSIAPFPHTGLREVDAVANMFTVTYRVLGRHVERLQQSVVGGDAPPTKEQATVAVVGLTDRSAGVFNDEATAVIETLRRYAALLASVAQRHGATTIAQDGASFLMVFGQGQGGGNGSAVRACRAALEILAALDQFNTYRSRLRKAPLRCSVGIHTGDVIIGAVPVAARTTRVVVGRALTGALAAQRDAMDEVRPLLLTAATAEEVGAAVRFEPLKDRCIRVGRETIPLFSVAQPPPHVDYRAMLEEMFGVVPPPPEEEET